MDYALLLLLQLNVTPMRWAGDWNSVYIQVMCARRA